MADRSKTMQKLQGMLTAEINGNKVDWSPIFDSMSSEDYIFFKPFLLAKDVVRMKETRSMSEKGETCALAREDAIVRGVVFMLLEECGWKG